MPKILIPLWRKPWHLALLSGVCVFLAFETFKLIPFILFFPVFFNLLSFQVRGAKKAFAWGFFTSFIVMLGGFYWVTYVVHEFGYLSWGVSSLLFLGFCGFGALNFPCFTLASYAIHRRVNWKKVSGLKVGLWFALGLPALFTLMEWFIPKLFPWYLGHCLFEQTWAIQLCEFTGTTFLTFSLYSLSSVVGLLTLQRKDFKPAPYAILLIPLSLWAIQIGFSMATLKNAAFDSKDKAIRIALIQANIGSLEKVAAEKGLSSKISYVMDRYKELTRQALYRKPQLILWPETAIPYQMEGKGPQQDDVRNFVKEIGIPLISGAYAQSPQHVYRDYNAAFLLDPTEEPLRTEVYYKNILLAFGEYMPLGDAYPKIYKYFPEVSDFEHGTKQNFFTLKDGTRIGMSICYEAIVPSFFRKVAANQVNLMVNLTNDSWFGPTSEPYLHGSLTIFRAIEHRVPLVRVTNTGTSFTVDRYGRRSATTPVFEHGILVADVLPAPTLRETFYGAWGDWFILVCVALLVGLGFSLDLSLKKKH